jgi:hypothetical protein
MKAFILFLSLSLVFHCLEEMTCDEPGFEVFKSKYGKVYKAEEEKTRYENFVAVCQIIANHNAAKSESTYTMAISQFADESTV